LLASGAATAASSEEPLPRSILVLNQTTAFRAWPSAIIGGMRAFLRENSDEHVQLFVENLDLYQFNSPQYEESLRQHFQEKYRGKPLGAIVPIGSSGFQHALKLRDAVWPSVPIVFAAVDEETATRFVFAPNVTGTAIEMTLESMVKTARALMPDLQRFAIISAPFEQQLYYRHFAEEIPRFAKELEFIDLIGLPVAEVRKRAGALPDHTVIFYLGINAEPDVSPAESLPLITEVANRPIIVDIETFLGTGALGGLILRPAQIGADTGRLVLRVLSGESASSIPIATGTALKPIFDGRQLERWKISEQRLPAGSEVRFREAGVWEQNRGQLLAMAAALLIQSAMIIWLVYEHRRRLNAEVVARNTIADLARINRVATAGALSASIAHEINQPLTGIVARASAALRWLSATTPDVEKARTLLTQIVDAGYRASEIVKSVRAMFKHQTQGGVPLNINNVILEVLALVRDDLQKHGITVQIRLNEQLPPAIGDRVQLQQVIMNLVMNAIEAMESVKDRRRVLRLKAELSEPGKLLVSVEDSGTGIDPSKVNRIFDPMFTTKERGMGMGLSICRSIIEAHHGQLWASPGKIGSIFQFVLPTGSPGQ
jgi:signal transduction histidine kinase